MYRMQLSLLLTVALLGMMTWLPEGADGFSLGRLFPASRSGVRGTLLSSLTSQKTSPAANALKEAVKEAQQLSQNQETVTPTPVTTPKPVSASNPVTNSPIYYIRLPPSPYVYMPGLGYVSPNTNTFKFVRPELDFVNNGRPSSIYHYKASSTTLKPFKETPDTFTTVPTTTTETPTTTTTITTTTTTSRPVKPVPSKKPSNVTWLQGPWFFNGRPSNLFIFRSPHNPGHFDTLHKKYSKQGTYF